MKRKTSNALRECFTICWLFPVSIMAPSVEESLLVHQCSGGGRFSPCWKHRQEHVKPGGDYRAALNAKDSPGKKDLPPFTPTENLLLAEPQCTDLWLSGTRVGHSAFKHGHPSVKRHL